MSAILFGSIGTIADTSELQRQAFNQAFASHGLGWEWSREKYAAMLEKSGGRKRIRDYAESVGQAVDVEAVHYSKSEIFQALLCESSLEPRPGVLEVMQAAKLQGFGLALVTTTSPANVLSVLQALDQKIKPSDFDLVVNAADVDRPKPARDAYDFALEKLGQKPWSCLAIEDNLGGVTAAKSAGLLCIAFPNQNTASHSFGAADLQVDRLNFAQLQSLLLIKQSKP